MSYNLSWFRNNFEKIRLDADRAKILEELQIAISHLSHAEIEQVIKELQLGIIFDCLNTSDKAQLQLAISVIKKCTSVMEPSNVIKAYGMHLGRALEHPDIEAKTLVLNELNRAAYDLNLLTIICRETPLLQSIVECLKNDNLSLASLAIHFLCELGKIDAGIQTLFSSPIIECLKQAVTTNDIVRYRIYEVIIDVSTTTASGLASAVKSDLLTKLLMEFQSDDILIKLNAIETVTKLALSDHGLKFLKDEGVFEYVNSQLKDELNLNSIWAPGYIKFFGNVAQVKPELIFEDYPYVMNLIFQLVDSDDPIISNVALETVGYISSNPLGKLFLGRFDSQMQTFVQTLGRTITTQLTDRKVIALNVFANIMHLELKDQTAELLEVTEKWFFMLSENPMKLLKDTCEKPFKELKLAGLHALHSLAVQSWGQVEINKCAGLIEYLLDRNEDSDMSCKSAKFDIVKIIFDCAFSREIFPSDVIHRFQLHIRQGVIFSEARPDVALESAL